MKYLSPNQAPDGLPPEHSLARRLEQIQKHNDHFILHGLKQHCATREFVTRLLVEWKADPKLADEFPTTEELKDL